VQEEAPADPSPAALTVAAVLVCTGQRVDRRLKPIGPRCGRTFDGETLDHAVAAGWRLGPAGTGLCPKCVHGDAYEPDSPSPELADQLSLFPTTEGPSS
jgi:hypothetical protein